jgi:hypothetical protein
MELTTPALQQHRQSISRNPAAIPPPREYFNETFNDRWIVEYVFPGKTDGYFVEAGAANGKAASSCYVLEQEFGWRGICIEPNPEFAQLIPQHRPNSIHEMVCLSDTIETVTFIFADDDPLIAPYISGVKENLENYKWQGDKIAAFDIEGSELKVIESFPFDEYTFLALSVEADEWIWERMMQRLSQFGYREVKNPFCDKIWEKYCIHESIWDESFAA